MGLLSKIFSNDDDLLEQKIKDFQALKNLKADGIVGTNTYKYLNL